MTKEQESDNKDVDNKTPNLPREESEVKPEEPKVEVDPAKAKWLEDTGTLENAYERSQGSAEEVEKYKKEAEDARQERADYQAQITADLKVVADNDPETAAKLFGYELPKAEESEVKINPDEIATKASNEAVAKIEVNNFYENNQTHFKDEDDWKNTQALALSFVGKIDSEGKPYTIQTALRDATTIRHPDLIGDKAISEHLTSEANRASASESGDTPTGSTPEDGKIDPAVEKHMEELAPELGITLDSETRDRIANRQSE